MKKHRENRISCDPTGSFATAKISILLSKHNYLTDILKTNWEKFLSTYQYSKKKQPKGAACGGLPHWKQSIGEQLEQKYHRHMLLQSPKGRPKGDEGKEIFYLKKEKFCHYNYFILAKLVDLIGAAAGGDNRVRKLIKITTKYLDLEKLFQITVSKNSLFLSWISYLLIGQIYQFIKKTSAFLYKSKLISTLGTVWGKKNKLEIQNKGNVLFLKCQDFLLLKWYENKIHAWSYLVLEGKETIFNQNYNRVSANSNINSILGNTDKHICYLQDETSSTHQKLMRCFDEKMPKPPDLRRKRGEGRPKGTGEGASLEKDLPEVPKGVVDTRRERYLRLIKNIIKKSKVSTQVKLIQKLNEIIVSNGPINNITKKKSIKLNFILYQLLWRWGLARHRKQKAKWIKNRYWSDLKTFFFDL